MAILKLILSTRLVLNSQRLVCLYLPSPEIKGMNYHAWHFKNVCDVCAHVCGQVSTEGRGKCERTHFLLPLWILGTGLSSTGLTTREFTHCAIFPAPKGLLNGRMKEKHKMLLGNHSKNRSSQIAPERNPKSAIHIRLIKRCLRTPLLLI